MADDGDNLSERNEKSGRNNIKSTLSSPSYRNQWKISLLPPLSHLFRNFHYLLSKFSISEIWTADQDEKLKELVAQHGMSWTKIGELFRERNGKQCRERWYNHLDPAVNKGEWTLEVRHIMTSFFYHRRNVTCY